MVKQSKSTPEFTSVEPPPPEVLSWQKVLLKATGLALVFVVILLLITALGVGVFAYSKLSTFLSKSNLTFTELRQLVSDGLNTTPEMSADSTNILILGLDSVSNKADAPPLTDTMMLLSINYKSGVISAVSLPRDLWSPEYKTKINALYYYGLEKYPDSPHQFPTEVIEEMTDIPIHHTVIFSLSSISELVGILDGIEIAIPATFTDTEFPREDVDISATTDADLLYETVTFEEGPEVMTAERVTKYIRSRHSEGETGTDLDRAARQQLVISALLAKIMSRQVLTNPETLAQLYIWYTERIGPYVTVTEAISIANHLYPVKNSVVLKSNSLSVTTAEAKGVIVHPPLRETDNQWTYIIEDQEKFRNEVKQLLAL